MRESIVGDPGPVKILLEDEDPKLFGYFAEHIYTTSSPVHEIIEDADGVLLARLYVLGARLGAMDFQKKIGAVITK